MRALLSYIQKHWGMLIAGLIFTLILGGFIAGYRLGPGLAITRSGTALIRNLPPNTSVFVDLSREHRVSADGSVVMRLSPGPHTIIVDAEGFQPWDELFIVESMKETVLAPIFVPKNVRAAEITGTDIAEANRLLYGSPLHTKSNPLFMHDGCVAVYATQNTLIAEASSTPHCTPTPYVCEGSACAPTIVHQTSDTLRAFMPFPGRDDTLVVVAGGRMYVLELDPREPQFTAPLFKGTYIVAAPWNTDAVVASDGNKTFVIPLSF